MSKKYYNNRSGYRGGGSYHRSRRQHYNNRGYEPPRHVGFFERNKDGIIMSALTAGITYAAPIIGDMIYDRFHKDEEDECEGGGYRKVVVKNQRGEIVDERYEKIR